MAYRSYATQIIGRVRRESNPESSELRKLCAFHLRFCDFILPQLQIKKQGHAHLTVPAGSHTHNLEGAPGFEPEIMGSKPIALPLGYAPVIWTGFSPDCAFDLP